MVFNDIQHNPHARQILDAEELLRQRKLEAERDAVNARTAKRVAEQKAQAEADRAEFNSAYREIQERDAAAEKEAAAKREAAKSPRDRGTSSMGDSKNWAQASDKEVTALLREYGVY